MLTEENKKLKLIQSHINTIETESKKINEQLNSFNLLIIDRQSYITALEKDIDHKSTIIEQRKQKLNQLTADLDAMNE